MLGNRQRLESRLEALSKEVREYPRPIARCDQHLGALLEERARLVAGLERLDEASARGCRPETAWDDDGGAGA